MSGLYWIDLLSGYRRGEREKCVDACAKAHLDGATWSCPIFTMGVDKVCISTEKGVLCRFFERKEEER